MSPLRPRVVLTRRPTLLLVFGLITAVGVGLVALWAGRLMHDAIHDQAMRDAERTSGVFVELALQPDEFRHGELTDEALGDLEAAVDRSRAVLLVRLWDRSGRMVYGSDGTRERSAERADLARVLSGQVLFHLGSPDGADLLKVTLPVRRLPSERPSYVLDLYMSYAPVRAQIASRVDRLRTVLVAGAIAFYLALLPFVLRASRALADAYTRRNAALQRDLRRAMARGELVPYFQPKVDLESMQVVGVEALIRWLHNDRGVVGPADFLPQAECTEVIGPLTRYIADRAFAEVGRWRRAGLHIDVAVNLSARNLLESDLADDLAALAATHGLDPADVTLEVTETAAMEVESDGVVALTRLRAAGFKLSIDDFGTGFSSLARLDRLPLDELKIDRRFISPVDSERGHTLVPTIVQLAHDLGLRTVAEGVESEAAAAWLRELGCDQAQGFLYSPPLPAAEIERLVERLGGTVSPRGTPQ
jgi:EAL domain-containing protein (putative c-di-GMP-specific phosphodiesterase class I)